MKILRYFFYLLIAVSLLSLAAVNSQVVTLHYYWGEWMLPLSLLIFFILCLGCFLGLLLSLGPLLKLRKECSQWRRQAKNAEKP
jgi:lipopolysaccharide assembly protein A